MSRASDDFDDTTTVPGGVRPDPAALPADEVLGNYVVVRPIGKGGQGIVYLARHVHLQTLHALKLLPPALFSNAVFREQFVREAQLMTVLEHPSIVRVTDCGVVKGKRIAYLVMEYVQGKGDGPTSLEDELTAMDGRGLPEARVKTIALQICAALEHAHAFHRGAVIHRDLKPGNVLLTVTDQVKVADFGLAQVLGEQYVREAEISIGRQQTVVPGTVEAQAASETVFGTVGYMSPEQLAGGQVTARSDLYSVGVILYRLLTGRRPAGTVRPPSTFGVSRAWDRIVDRCMEFDPDDRYASAADLHAAIARVGLTRAGTRWPAWVKLAAAACLLAGLAGVVCAFWPRNGQDHAIEAQTRAEAARVAAEHLNASALENSLWQQALAEDAVAVRLFEEGRFPAAVTTWDGAAAKFREAAELAKAVSDETSRACQAAASARADYQSRLGALDSKELARLARTEFEKAESLAADAGPLARSGTRGAAEQAAQDWKKATQALDLADARRECERLLSQQDRSRLDSIARPEMAEFDHASQAAGTEFIQGRYELARKKWNDALACLRRAVARGTSWTDPGPCDSYQDLLSRGNAAVREGRWEDAKKVFGQVLALRGHEDDAVAKVRLDQARIKTGGAAGDTGLPPDVCQIVDAMPNLGLAVELRTADGRTTLRDGDELSFRARAAERHHLILLLHTCDGPTVVVFPTKVDDLGATLGGEQSSLFPTPGADKGLRASGDQGQDVLQALVATDPEALRVLLQDWQPMPMPQGTSGRFYWVKDGPAAILKRLHGLRGAAGTFGEAHLVLTMSK